MSDHIRAFVGRTGRRAGLPALRDRGCAVFSERGNALADLEDPQRLATGDRLQAELRKLTPENDIQGTQQARALELSNEVARLRLLAITQTGGPIPTVVFVVLLFWLALMFAGFGLITSKSPMIIVALSLCRVIRRRGLYDGRTESTVCGLVKISSAPMRFALAHPWEVTRARPARHRKSM